MLTSFSIFPAENSMFLVVLKTFICIFGESSDDSEMLKLTFLLEKSNNDM